MMKKYLIPTVLTLVLLLGSLALGYFGRNHDFDQLIWIGIILVVFNCMVAWLTFFRQSYLAYLYFAVGGIILILISLNVFWISSRTL